MNRVGDAEGVAVVVGDPLGWIIVKPDDPSRCLGQVGMMGEREVVEPHTVANSAEHPRQVPSPRRSLDFAQDFLGGYLNAHQLATRSLADLSRSPTAFDRPFLTLSLRDASHGRARQTTCEQHR